MAQRRLGRIPRRSALLLIPLKRSPEVTLSRMLMVGNGFGRLEDHPDPGPDKLGSVSGA